MFRVFASYIGLVGSGDIELLEVLYVDQEYQHQLGAASNADSIQIQTLELPSPQM